VACNRWDVSREGPRDVRIGVESSYYEKIGAGIIFPFRVGGKGRKERKLHVVRTPKEITGQCEQ